MTNWLRTTTARLHTTLTTTDHRRDKGQTAVEYLGIIAVVVAIVLAITGTDIGQTIYDAIVDKVDEVING
ncbi:membrane protein [Streptomyces sp. NRRL F-5650]|uniref:membrane protein n=1 Tax=Streptomyces sp. NRRL F-5650 TaxID=1463868 RepID=UPI0004C7584C|nr:membrane protein [Streptomyces sp. NRRL F-5650]